MQNKRLVFAFLLFRETDNFGETYFSITINQSKNPFSFANTAISTQNVSQNVL
jgi:hypothetical protein